MHYVYVLLSKRDGKLYLGFTTDLKQRLKEHNGGKVQSTKPRRPLSSSITKPIFPKMTHSFKRITSKQLKESPL